MTCCNHRCNQGRACTARRRLINITRALTGYAVVLGFFMCAAMAGASWLALAMPHGGA